MKHCSPFCAGIWPFLLFPLLLLPVLYFQWHAIEEDIANNAKIILSEKHAWASVESYHRGRDVLLTGIAPDNNAVDQAISQAKSAHGVRTASFIGSISAAVIAQKPARLSLEKTANTLILNGEVDSQATIDATLAEAKRLFPSRDIQNNLTIGGNVSELSNIAAMLSALNINSGDINLDSNQGAISYNTVVYSQIGKASLIAAMTELLPGSSHNIEIAPPKCQEEVKLLLANSKINFRTASAEISSVSDGLLNSIAEQAMKCDTAEFEISGHTDITGNAEFNQNLSQQRAQAVLNRLAGLNVNKDRFVVRGYGSSKPIADNTTASGRAKNRRIEFEVTN